MKKIRTILFLLPLAAVGLVSCKDGSGPEPSTGKKHRTVIEYMVADNNLYSSAVENINDMEGAWDPTFDGHMVVYLHPVAASGGADFDPAPRLLLIERDPNGPADRYNPNASGNKIVSRVLKTYDRDQDPCDPAVMGRILADAMQLAPADHYGLVMWSHGSGWLPKGVKQPLRSVVPPVCVGGMVVGGAVSKLIGSVVAADDADATGRLNGGIVGYSFGQSASHGNSEMEIDAMAAALPAGTVFDFILFDACHMACVELAWEVREHAEYTIGSVAEVMGAGFPYLKIMEPMFASDKADVQGIAREFYDYYNGLSGYSRSATVSVVRNGELPALAAAMKALCDGTPPAIPLADIQQFGRERDVVYGYYYGFGNTFFDLGDFVDRTWSASDPAGVETFEAALAAAVPYAYATETLFNNQIVVNRHCGLSCYIPRTSTPLSLEAYRSRFGWSEASGMGALVP